MLSNIRIVLVETSHPGNIGAVARAMKNMCLFDLRLVRPKVYPNAEATARASGADDLLMAARCHDDLLDALAGCRLVVGASARLRSVEWPQLDPRACAARVLQEAGSAPVAMVFGRENSGLSNEELACCHFLVHIPANPEYSSLNLAMAVQTLAYELRMTQLSQDSAYRSAPLPELADPVLVDCFNRHLEQTMADLGFSDPRQSEKLILRLRRLFARARPDRDELNILHGLLSACQGRKSMRREQKS
jgi:TrmH family RNA methyltransferase